MANITHLTFKAGLCTLAGRKITPLPTPGYIYLITSAEDEMLHFCWRPRSASADNPTLDLLMVPDDGTFRPLLKDNEASKSPTNGRVFGLRFESSSQKYYFWMQSKSEGDAVGEFGERDRRIGGWVDAMLQGEEVDVEAEEARQQTNGTGGGDAHGDGDADAMEVDEGQGSGGGGAMGSGDTREEGETSREGGADGGRAPTGQQQESQDPSALVSNFLASLNNPTTTSASQSAPREPYPTLSDLLSTATTIPFLATCPEATLDALCAYLPPDLFHHTESSSPLTPVIPSLSADQKREILARVMRSPQLHQSLGSLTVALRDGGLPIVGEALGLRLQHGGTIKGGSMPLGGDAAVEEFVEGVRRTVEGKK